MKIASISEDKNIEKRVSITPEIAKKYLSNGFEVSLSKNYGDHLGFSDKEYESLGVKLAESNKDVIKDSNIIIQLGLPTDENLSYFQENQILIGVLNPYSNKNKLDELNKKKINMFSLELLPESHEHSQWIYFHLKQI